MGCVLGMVSVGLFGVLIIDGLGLGVNVSLSYEVGFVGVFGGVLGGRVT